MIPFIHLKFILETEISIYPYFPEALIRGGFGHELKRIVCINKRAECRDCFLSKSCVFAILFVNNASIENNEFKNINKAPRPYSFYVKNDGKRSKIVNFDMILFRDAFNYIQQIVWTFFRMGENGFGKERIGYIIRDIIDLSSDKSIYEDKVRSLKNAQVVNFNYNFNEINGKRKNFSIDIASPTRIHQNNKFNYELSFKDIIKYSLIRGGLLTELYGEKSEEVNPAEILNLAESVETVKTNINWSKRQRYSETQEKKVSMGGVTGNIEYYGEIDPFKAILKIPEIFGIGKNTTFGRGRMKLVENGG
ncbi:MAG: CRISPR system precrRNA processing endoribonuclease RAMP protein Cas6 [Spirochaetes bacterium]|nr:CRISPR system precrRNA processing endoribonuclease RAMP protein Cas6 [Spirochaetota bacterium]